VRLTEIYFLGLLLSILQLGKLMKTQTTCFRKLSVPEMPFADPVFSDGGSHRFLEISVDYYNCFFQKRGIQS